MEYEIYCEFVKLAKKYYFQLEIDQNSDEGVENAPKTFLHYVNVSKLNI